MLLPFWRWCSIFSPHRDLGASGPVLVPQTGWPTAGEGQSRADLWGLEDLEPRVMEDTDNDSVLMLRQMYLTSLAYKGLGQLSVPQVGSSFLEHPMDPMECSKSPSAARCSSIWVTRAYVQWARALHHSLIKFDECRLGQVVVKSTALSTDLPLHHWHDLRCNHGSHPRGEKLRPQPVPGADDAGSSSGHPLPSGTRPGGAEAGGHGAPG